MKDQSYKGYMISYQDDSKEFWVYHPLFRMYKIPKFKTISGAKRWIDKSKK